MPEAGLASQTRKLATRKRSLNALSGASDRSALVPHSSLVYLHQ